MRTPGTGKTKSFCYLGEFETHEKVPYEEKKKICKWKGCGRRVSGYRYAAGNEYCVAHQEKGWDSEVAEKLFKIGKSKKVYQKHYMRGKRANDVKYSRNMSDKAKGKEV